MPSTVPVSGALARSRSFPAAAAILLTALALLAPASLAAAPDPALLKDREDIESLQKQAFLWFWEAGDPESGLAYEADFGWDNKPLAVGGTGFGIAALVVATDRGWVTREQAVERLFKICRFLERVSLPEWHGGFPHWLDARTGQAFDFGDGTDVIDTVETSFLVQGLIMARSYFNGPGSEASLREAITALWEAVDWQFFTNGQERGIFWHWSVRRGFLGLKVKGYNEALITYVLAASSPTPPKIPKALRLWYDSPHYPTPPVFG
jgi:hypothetical protein